MFCFLFQNFAACCHVSLLWLWESTLVAVPRILDCERLAFVEEGRDIGVGTADSESCKSWVPLFLASCLISVWPLFVVLVVLFCLIVNYSCVRLKGGWLGVIRTLDIFYISNVLMTVCIFFQWHIVQFVIVNESQSCRVFSGVPSVFI